MLPDQSYNLAIAGRHLTSLFVESLQRLPGRPPGGRVQHQATERIRGLIFGGAFGWGSAPSEGTGGARAGASRSSTRSHRPRLRQSAAVLPTTLALGLGWASSLPRGVLQVAAAGLLVHNLAQGAPDDPEQREVDAAVAATAQLVGPFLSTNPWFYSRDGGWIEQPVPPRAAGQDRLLTPDQLQRFARERGFAYIVADPARVRRTYPRLKPLLQERPIAGLELVVESGDWRVWAVEGVDRTKGRPNPGRTPSKPPGPPPGPLPRSPSGGAAH